MKLEILALSFGRGAALIALGLAAMPLLKRASSDARRVVLALALGGALVLPALSAVAPAWRIEAPTAFIDRVPLEPLSPDETAARPAAALPAQDAIAPARSAIASSVALSDVIFAVWVAGALAIMGRLAIEILRARAIARRSRPAPSGWTLALAKAARVTARVAEVRETDELDAPAVVGVFSPVVLIPLGSEEWSSARKEAVLVHELSHVRQGDCLTQIVAELACAVHWFNPLVWIASRKLRVERELAADDAVILSGARPSTYAEDLLSIARARSAPSTALGMADGANLESRVGAIVAASRPRRPLSFGKRASLVALTSGVVLMLACATPERETAAPPSKEPASASSSAAPAASAAPEGTSIDPAIQAIADTEIDQLMKDWSPAAAVVLVIDPSTGAILANAGRANGARADVALTKPYVTGSTFKSITLAAALEEGAITAEDRFDCTNGKRAYGDKILHDVASNGTLSVPEMLAVSTNVGFSRIFDKLGGERLVRWTHKFHFGEAPDLAGAAAGEIPDRVTDASFEGAVFAIGESASATPLQMAAAYTVFASGGIYMAPTLKRGAAASPERLLRPETARAVVSMLREAVNGERATGKAARVEGVVVAGKTGTGEYRTPEGTDAFYSSFVGFAPAERPRFVVLVGADRPKDSGSGGSVAAPVFARVVAKALGR